MTREHITTSLRFLGDWPWWLGVTAALVLGSSAFVLYRRDVRQLGHGLRWLLPGLRALAIAMLVLMLSGPVLHHRKIIGELAPLRLFVDGSQSMQLTDSSMSAARKILILQRMGLLSEGAVKMDLANTAEALADAQTLAENAKASPGLSTPEWKKIATDFAAKIGEARERLTAAGGDAERQQRFTKDLHDPSREIAGRELKQIDDRKRATEDLAKLGELARRWQEELNDAFQKTANELSAGESSPLRAAMQKFDTLPRWERVQSILLGASPSDSLLGKLAENYDVQLLELDGGEAKKIWQPTAKNSTPPTALPKPDGEITNLGTGVKSGAGGESRDEAPASAEAAKPRGAVVIFTDGQHNEGESPVEVAKLLAGRQMPVFTIGLGSQVRPRDLAIVKTEAPEAVFYQDRVRGQITLKDDLPAGQAFKVSISDGDKVVWEQQLVSENKQLRKVPFDFAMKELVEGRLAAAKTAASEVQVAGVPLELKVAVSQVEGDREASNNEGGLRLRAVTQKRKVLILDGRSRWETRYIRNLFDRDEQWEVNAVFAGAKVGEPGFQRGEKDEQFPSEPALLEPYDLIVFGEVPASLWKGDELKWIADFVAQRGGAIVFIDGARGRFREYASTPLGPLFPVEFKTVGMSEGITKLALTERAQTLAPFTLGGDRAQNAELWQTLKPPHWISGATPLPGAEVLLEAEVKGQKVAAVVQRPFGAGKVLYHGFDDSWRWRFEVADQHHVKYWQQAANWLAELPFAVRDKFVSLDAGSITYRPGESADLRVRLRDGEGKPVANASVDAVLYRDGKKVATIRLTAEEVGGLYRGKTASLEPGNYEIAVQTAAIAERDTKARTQFKVEARETGELTLLNCNEDLLKQMAAASGGQYLREENVGKLAGFLAPLSQGKVIESDTVLWQSWWWFLLLIGLLTIEWVLRKRAGLL